MNDNKPLSPEQRFYSVSNLRDQGFSYYKINKMVEQHLLSKMNNKMYENALYTGDESDFSAAAAYAPKGVICMMSAARYYGLTNYLPDAVDIAIERDMKISTVPEWPRFHIWYFPEKRYETGIITEKDEYLLVEFIGDFDSLASRDAENDVAPVYEHDTDVVIECSQLNYVSSSGLRIFLSIYKHVHKNGKKVTVRGLNSNIEKVFRISGFLQLFDTK